MDNSELTWLRSYRSFMAKVLDVLLGLFFSLLFSIFIKVCVRAMNNVISLYLDSKTPLYFRSS
jgi:hypothetical protein